MTRVHSEASDVDPTTAGHDVLVVGSFVVGMVVRTESLPQSGETLIGDAYDVGPGGKGTNAAIAAARSGARTAFVGRVGDDLHAEMAGTAFDEEGIDATELRRTAGTPTGVGLVHLDHQQENCIAVFPGANDLLRPEDVEEATGHLGIPKVIVCQNEIPQETCDHIISWGYSNSVTVILNSAPFRPIRTDILRMVEVVIFNEGEARATTHEPGGDILQVAKRLQNLTGKWVIITTGSSGCIVAGPESYISRMAAHQVHAVDTTGAGDTFTGAFAAAIADGASVDGACRWALAAAALSTTAVGSIDAIPDHELIREFKRNDPNIQTSGTVPCSSY